MLNNLFTSKTRVLILRELLFSTEKIHLRGLARKINITPIYVKKELANLQNIGIVKQEKLANLTLYNINPDCPVLSELRSLFIKLGGKTKGTA